MTASRWYVLRDGRSIGPCTLAEVGEGVAAGRIALTDLATREEDGTWRPVAEVLADVLRAAEASALRAAGKHDPPRPTEPAPPMTLAEPAPHAAPLPIALAPPGEAPTAPAEPEQDEVVFDLKPLGPGRPRRRPRRWQMVQDGALYDPFELARLRAYARDGRLREHDPVRADDETLWTEAAQVTELADCFPSAPARPSAPPPEPADPRPRSAPLAAPDEPYELPGEEARTNLLVRPGPGGEPAAPPAGGRRVRVPRLEPRGGDAPVEPYDSAHEVTTVRGPAKDRS